MELEDHYGQLLGIESPWEISSVDLKMQDQRVDIIIEYTDDQGLCPECGMISPKHDNRKKRTWRHLDTMQFSTYLHCDVPRVRCKTHGAKTVSLPWVGKNSRFTLLFEAFAIRVLTAARSVEEARKLLGLNWHQVEAIKARMIKNHLPNILTYFKHPITNAAAGGLNSKIQTIKANARGYRSFNGFRNSILFYCGGLDMAP